MVSRVARLPNWCIVNLGISANCGDTNIDVLRFKISQIIEQFIRHLTVLDQRLVHGGETNVHRAVESW